MNDYCKTMISNLGLTLKFLKRWKKILKKLKKPEMCHDCMSASASAISDIFALACLKKSCARALNLTNRWRDPRKNLNESLQF